MNWKLDEAISHYQRLGAPRDQSALVGLLREVQQENNGTIPAYLLEPIAGAYRVKVSFLLAIIKRFPSLRLSDTYCLELCAGPNCGKHVHLAACAEMFHRNSGQKFQLKFVPCMRMCGKGSNVKWNGTIYHNADEALLQKLLQDANIKF